MLSNNAANSSSLNSTQRLVIKARRLAGRRIWLPKLVYDSLPYFYLSAGFAAFFGTLYISEWFWVLPHYLLFSAACLHLAVRVSRMRSRSKQSIDDVDRPGG